MRSVLSYIGQLVVVAQASRGTGVYHDTGYQGGQGGKVLGACLAAQTGRRWSRVLEIAFQPPFPQHQQYAMPHLNHVCHHMI